uniref:Uncharacterized protein n=1 Tax=Oryza meridionalis TaxID=40149 RepID=A0A0E0FBZ5_9ORYZ
MATPRAKLAEHLAERADHNGAPPPVQQADRPPEPEHHAAARIAGPQGSAISDSDTGGVQGLRGTPVKSTTLVHAIRRKAILRRRFIVQMSTWVLWPTSSATDDLMSPPHMLHYRSEIM